MPAARGEPIGSFPPGAHPAEYDRLRRRVLWKMPTGLYVVGSRAGERRNGMTCSWVTQVSFDPKLVGVAVEAGALTHQLIADGAVFALSILARSDAALVRRFVKPAEHDPAAGTIGGQRYHERATGAPILDAAAAWLDCRVVHAVPTGSHTLFVGEVIHAGFAADEETPVLRMEDTRMSYGG